VLPACQSTSHGSHKYIIASQFAPLFSSGLLIALLQSGHAKECFCSQLALRESINQKISGVTNTTPPRIMLDAKLGKIWCAMTNKGIGDRMTAHPLKKVMRWYEFAVLIFSMKQS
jgi:hypothetical protein